MSATKPTVFRPSEPGEYSVVVYVERRRIVTVYGAFSPQDAANKAERMMEEEYPDMKVRSGQVNYWTPEGGESHWYPADRYSE